MVKVGDRVTAPSIYTDELLGTVISLIPAWPDVCLVEWDHPIHHKNPLFCVRIDQLTIVGHYVPPPTNLTADEAALWFQLMREQTFLDLGWDPDDLKGIEW